MPAVIAGFNVTRVATTAPTQISAAGAANYVVTRFVGGAAASTLYICNGTSTAAANRVAELKVAAGSVDETGIPVRCQDGVRVNMTTIGVAYIGLR